MLIFRWTYAKDEAWHGRRYSKVSVVLALFWLCWYWYFRNVDVSFGICKKWSVSWLAANLAYANPKGLCLKLIRTLMTLRSLCGNNEYFGGNPRLKKNTGVPVQSLGRMPTNMDPFRRFSKKCMFPHGNAKLLPDVDRCCRARTWKHPVDRSLSELQIQIVHSALILHKHNLTGLFIFAIWSATTEYNPVTAVHHFPSVVNLH